MAEGEMMTDERATAGIAEKVVARGTGVGEKQIPDIRRSMEDAGIPQEQIDRAMLERAKLVNPRPVEQTKPASVQPVPGNRIQ